MLAIVYRGRRAFRRLPPANLRHASSVQGKLSNVQDKLSNVQDKLSNVLRAPCSLRRPVVPHATCGVRIGSVRLRGLAL
jgi:hypothetical protein